MKKTNKWVLALLAVMLLTTAGCQSVATADASTNAGQIEEGIRVIEISAGFSSETITVNRGEELNIIYTGENQGVSLSVPGYEAENSSETNTVELFVKAKTEGEFELTATDGDASETGILSVEAYQNEAVYRSVGPAEFEAAMTGDYFLLDVRTQDEYDEVHIDGATLISVYELEARLDEIAAYKETPVLVYCRSGNRSVVASQILVQNGFMNVTNLEGGISGWLNYQAGK